MVTNVKPYVHLPVRSDAIIILCYVRKRNSTCRSLEATQKPHCYCHSLTLTQFPQSEPLVFELGTASRHFENFFGFLPRSFVVGDTPEFAYKPWNVTSYT